MGQSGVFKHTTLGSIHCYARNESMKHTKYLVVIFTFLASASVYAGLLGPSNLWECILEEMPGVKNDPAAIEVIRKCKKEFPSTPEVKKKSPIFGVSTAGECVIEYAKDVSSPRGAKYIRAACYKLYPKE
jgi:hypothetical protein